MKTIILEGDVGWELTPGKLRSELPNDGEDVLIKVYSLGGSVYDGIEMYNIIKDYPGYVSVLIGAISASAASIFPLAADYITVRKNSTEMIHKAWSFAVGNSLDMSKTAEILSGLDNILAEIYADRTGKKKSKILKDMESETWLFGGREIVDYGFADEIEEGDEEEDPDLVAAKSKAMAKIEGIKARMRSSEEYRTDSEKAVAFFPEKKGVISKIINRKKQDTPAKAVDTVSVGNGNNFTEGRMNLIDLLNENPEAKAENKALQEAAKAEGKKEATKEVAAKTVEILDLAGVRLSPETRAAIENGKDPGEFAKEILKASNAAKPPQPNSGEIKGVGAAPEPKDDLPGKENLPGGRVPLHETYKKKEDK